MTDLTEGTARTPEMLAAAMDEFAINPNGGKMAAIAYKRCASMIREWLVTATPAALSASPAPAVAEGWKLVPVRPTPEMISAYAGEGPADGYVDFAHEDRADAAMQVYSAMIAAAPRAPSLKNEWRSMDSAPKDGTRFLAAVDGECRVVRWGKTSHIPIYGFSLADQGAEDADLCRPECWQPIPTAPTTEDR